MSRIFWDSLQQVPELQITNIGVRSQRVKVFKNFVCLELNRMSLYSVQDSETMFSCETEKVHRADQPAASGTHYGQLAVIMELAFRSSDVIKLHYHS